MRRLLLAAAALVPLASAANAAPDPAAHARAANVFANLGAALALDDSLTDAGLERGGVLELGAGVSLAPHVALELAGGFVRFAHAQSGRVRDPNDPAAPVEDLTLRKTVSVIPLTGSVRVSARLGPVEVHALGGAGAYVASLHGTRVSSLYPTSTFSDTDACFGVHAGAGIAAAVAPHLDAGVAARYLKATATFRIASSASTTTAQSIELENRLDSVLLTAAISYRF